jgi:predicted NUDIX family phosphoesterase
MSEENILVVPRAVFEKIGAFQGLSLETDRYIQAFLDPANNLFMPRSLAEEDPTHKQIIPYLVIRVQNRILTYTRGKSGGEARLHAKISLGIGGHMNDGDSHAKHFDHDAYLRAVERELHEELEITAPYHQRIAGLINDDSNEVGRVHLGVVHLIDLDQESVQAREDAIHNLQLLTPTEIIEKIEDLESWSAICARGFDQMLSA